MSDLSRALQSRHVGFPPGRTFLMLPAAPSRAFRAGLALYDGVEPKQRLALAAGRAVAFCRLQRFLPSVEHPEVDWEWWSAWLDEVAQPLIGNVQHVAVRVPPTARACMLLMDDAGRPTGFAKILDTPRPEFSHRIRDYLTNEPLRFVRTPATLDEGVFEGKRYVLFEPLPEGPHRRPPFDPVRVRAILDELHQRLDSVERAPDVPDRYQVTHTGFTPRNMRVASDGQWWLYDWDYVTWGPRLVTELRYWTAEFVYRLRPHLERDSRRVLSLLRERGSDADIAEALHWPDPTRSYRHLERDIYHRIAELIGDSAQATRPAAPASETKTTLLEEKLKKVGV